MAQKHHRSETWENEPLSGNLMQYLEGHGAEDRVRAYYLGSDQEQPFTGGQFELFAGGGDRRETEDTFTPDDIVAVSLLSVRIRGDAALAILDPKSGHNELLAKIPKNTTLWDAEVKSVNDDKSDAAKLWYRLEKIKGVGWVTANKLLARKRPQLIPVYDKVVKAALQPGRSEFWLPLRNSLLADNEQALKRLREIKANVGLNDDYSLLRVMDVAVWMTSRWDL